MKVHFICRGNALRSVLAEAYLKSLNLPGVEVMSSGTVAEQYRTQNMSTLTTTNALLNKEGLGRYTKTQSEQLIQDSLDKSDINICMNQTVYDEGRPKVTFPANTIVWDIIDAGEGNRVLGPNDEHTKYDQLIYDDIKLGVDNLIKTKVLYSKP